MCVCSFVPVADEHVEVFCLHFLTDPLPPPILFDFRVILLSCNPLCACVNPPQPPSTHFFYSANKKKMEKKRGVRWSQCCLTFSLDFNHNDYHSIMIITRSFITPFFFKFFPIGSPMKWKIKQEDIRYGRFFLHSRVGPWESSFSLVQNDVTLAQRVFSFANNDAISVQHGECGN